MKNILLGCLCILTYTLSEVTALTTPPPDIDPTELTRTIKRSHIHPIRPVVQPVLVHEYYNYYTNVVSNCDEYIRIIAQKDHEIDMLKEEIKNLKGKEYTEIQKNLKTEYEQELKKFDERKSGIKNSIDDSAK